MPRVNIYLSDDEHELWKTLPKGQRSEFVSRTLTASVTPQQARGAQAMTASGVTLGPPLLPKDMRVTCDNGHLRIDGICPKGCDERVQRETARNSGKA